MLKASMAAGVFLAATAVCCPANAAWSALVSDDSSSKRSVDLIAQPASGDGAVMFDCTGREVGIAPTISIAGAPTKNFSIRRGDLVSITLAPPGNAGIAKWPGKVTQNDSQATSVAAAPQDLLDVLAALRDSPRQLVVNVSTSNNKMSMSVSLPPENSAVAIGQFLDACALH